MNPPAFLIKRALQEEESGERAARYGRNAAIGVGAPLLAGGLAARPIVEAGKPLVEAAGMMRKFRTAHPKVDIPEELYVKALPKYIEGARNVLQTKMFGKSLLQHRLSLAEKVKGFQDPEGNPTRMGKLFSALLEGSNDNHLQAFGTDVKGGLERALEEGEHGLSETVSGRIGDILTDFDNVASRHGEHKALQTVLARKKWRASVVSAAEKKLRLAYGRAGERLQRRSGILARTNLTGKHLSAAERYANRLKLLKGLPYVGGGLMAGGLGLEALRQYQHGKAKSEDEPQVA